MVELIEPLQEQPLDDHPGDADQHGRKDERPPVAKPCIFQEEESGEGAQHVLGAMGEVDDVEHAEDHGQPKAEQRVERAVDQPDQQLPEQGLWGDAEQFEQDQLLFTSGHPPSESGRNASSAGMVARSLSRSHGPFNSLGFFTSNRYMG